MKTHPVSVIEWTGLDLDDVVWQFPSTRIPWNIDLVIKENQAAAIFAGRPSSPNHEWKKDEKRN